MIVQDQTRTLFDGRFFRLIVILYAHESAHCKAQKGKHADLLLEKGVYRDLYAMQLKEQTEHDSPNYKAGRFGLEHLEEA